MDDPKTDIFDTETTTKGSIGSKDNPLPVVVSTNTDIAITTIPQGSVAKKPKGFQKGNRCGKGNQHQKKVADYREAFLSVVTPQAVEEMVKVLLREAMKGEDWALRYALDRALGKPVAYIDATVVASTLKTYMGIDIDAV